MSVASPERDAAEGAAAEASGPDLGETAHPGGGGGDARGARGITPVVWPWLYRGFARYGRRFVRRHFNAVRVLRGAAAADPAGRPIVVVLNHPAWWDPMIGLVLAEHAFPGRHHFAPIDAAMLGKYALFERLGFFGVEPGSARGAAQLLRTGGAILGDPASAIWITAQGGFADVRQRPVRLQGGAARLAQRCPEAAVLPMAVEYAFWQEKRPEALVAFGEPIDGRALAHDNPSGATHRVEAALTAVMDRLAAAVITRDPGRFETVLAGRSGIGGAYDAWRRAVAWARGRRFDPRHEAEHSVDQR